MTAPARPCALVVMGVSGSGKSTIAALVAQRLGWTFEDGDWFHPPANVEKMASGTPLTDEDRLPWLQAIAGWIDTACASGQPGVVACSALKRAYRAVLVGDHGDAVRIVYLDGDRQLIENRMALRQGHFMPSTLLDSQFAALEPPGADERPISVAISAHPRDVAEAVVTALDNEARASSRPDLGDPA